MVLPQRFRSFFFFVLLSSYCGVWFIVSLLWRGPFHRLIGALNLCGADSNNQNGVDRSKISDFGHQYVEELEL